MSCGGSMYDKNKEKLFLELADDLRELADRVESAALSKRTIEDAVQLLREFEEARKLFK